MLLSRVGGAPRVHLPIALRHHQPARPTHDGRPKLCLRLPPVVGAGAGCWCWSLRRRESVGMKEKLLQGCVLVPCQTHYCIDIYSTSLQVMVTFIPTSTLKLFFILLYDRISPSKQRGDSDSPGEPRREERSTRWRSYQTVLIDSPWFSYDREGQVMQLAIQLN